MKICKTDLIKFLIKYEIIVLFSFFVVDGFDILTIDKIIKLTIFNLIVGTILFLYENRNK